MNKTQPSGKNRSEQQREQARSGLRVPLPVALAGLGMLAAGAPAHAATFYPQGVDDAYTMTQGQTLTADVGVNDYSWNGSTQEAVNKGCVGYFIDKSIGSQSYPPSHGTATITTSGVLTYVPDPGYLGQDKLKYFLHGIGGANCQGEHGCTYAEVTITVEPPKPTPTPTPVPTLAPVALGGLGALLGVLGMRRRQRRD